MIRYLIGLTALVTIGWTAYFVVNQRLYPVAVVNWQIVTGKEWSASVVPAFDYYKKIKQPGVDDAVLRKEVERAVLDTLIEQKLIYRAIDQTQIDQQISTIAAQNQNLKEGAQKLYHLSWEDFQQLILRPQAALDLLQGQLQQQHETVENWLTQKKAAGTIFIFARGFSWNGSHVVAN